MTIPFGIDAGIPRRGNLRDGRGRGGNPVDGIEALDGLQQRMPNLAAQGLVQMLLKGFPTIGTAFEINATDTRDRVFEFFELLLLMMELFFVEVLMMMMMMSVGALALSIVVVVVVDFGTAGISLGTAISVVVVVVVVSFGTVMLILLGWRRRRRRR